MVRIAIAGGSGQVAQEVIDVLVASRKHDLVILSRTHQPVLAEQRLGVTWHAVSYGNTNNLREALTGVHTVLSFIQLLSDPNQESQKNLIDAAIAAGVKRFAPSEYGSSETTDMPWWSGKQIIREYLETVNKNGKILEYTLFQPGLFLDYLASPYKTAKYVAPLDTMFDFQNHRAIVVEGHDAVFTLTAVHDLAQVISKAVDYTGEWPIHGGIRGNRLTVSQILSIGEKIRGHPFNVERVKFEDLEAGILKTSWVLGKHHSAVSEDDVAHFKTMVLIGMLLSSAKGAWDVPDAFNSLFPDHKYAEVEAFLGAAWEGKS